MRILIACVGKMRDPSLAAVTAEYERRAGRYWPVEVAEVREERGRSLVPNEVRRREGVRLAERIGEAMVIACDESGEQFSSRAFSAFLQGVREGARDAAFVIGGANGLDPVLRDRARRAIALAPWTLPHELARLVLAEQLYRAGTIVRGEPYHK